MTGPFNKKSITVQASTALACLLLFSGCSTLDSIKDKSSVAAHSMFVGNTGGGFSNRVYTGVSAGAARLSPDTDGTRFTLSDRAGGATQLRLGADVNSKLSLELDTSILGAASVREVDADVSYTSFAGSAIFYALGSEAKRRSRVGMQGYGRLGLASLQRASIVQPFDGSEYRLVAGIGAEYGLRNGLSFRGEVSRFDSDATLLSIGLVYRLGMSARQFGNVVASVAADTIPRDTESKTPQLGAAQPEYELAPGHVSLVRQGPNASLWSQPKSAADMDGDGVVDSDDICNDTLGNTAVSQQGCGLFDSVLPDVTFKSGTYWLTPESRRVIDDLVGTLLAFPEARVEVQAHADSEGPDEVNNIISQARAEAVVSYMLKHGVGKKQLVAKGYGETKPIASNDTVDGRKKNRRIQLVTLPSLTPIEIESQSPSVGSSSTQLAAETNETKKPTIAVTMKPDELQELADAAQRFAPAHSNQASSSNISSKVNSNEPELAAALAASPSLAFEPAVRVKRLGLGGPLKGVKFKPGTTELESGAAQSLDKMASQLEENEKVQVALLVHVNEVADNVANLSLSREQANVLVDYLASKGISRDRLSAEAYGDTLPLSQTVNESDRDRNRRVEVRVINP